MRCLVLKNVRFKPAKTATAGTIIELNEVEAKELAMAGFVQLQLDNVQQAVAQSVPEPEAMPEAEAEAKPEPETKPATKATTRRRRITTAKKVV